MSVGIVLKYSGKMVEWEEIDNPNNTNTWLLPGFVQAPQ